MVTGGFIERHGLWTDDQHRRAKALAARVKKEKLKLFRVAWVDPHGAARAKTVTLPAFLDALKNGYNINVATTTLDASGARTFASFTSGRRASRVARRVFIPSSRDIPSTRRPIWTGCRRRFRR
jgi:hypothetical protein